MNLRLTGYLLGVMMLFTGASLSIPMVISLSFNEPILFSYVFSMLILLVGGVCLSLLKPKNTSMKAKGGFVTVALCWLVLSVGGSLPYVLSGAVPNFIDALFESVSGFSTTGSTILPDIEAVPKSLLMWRSLTQWIGGIGVLVFVIAVLPKTDGKIYQIFKAEVPGPQKGKLVSKLSLTARILALIYFVLTAVLTVLLLLGGVPVFDAFILAFSTASTGGFSSLNSSVAAYGSLYVELILTLFMFVFSVNFTLFYFVLIGKAKDALKSEELRWFAAILMLATLAISFSLYVGKNFDNFWTCLRYSLFYSTSIVSTTGFTVAGTANWPAFAQFVLLLLMFVGGCAGSTAGGLKVSRIILFSKSGTMFLKSGLNGSKLVDVKLDGKTVDKSLVHNAFRYLMLYIAIVVVSVLLLMAYNPAYSGVELFVNSFDAVVSSINNIGPGLFRLSSGNMYEFCGFSKVVLMFVMLAGRLELLPIFMLFTPSAWKR